MNEIIPLIKCRQLTLGYGSKDLVRDLDYDVNVEDYLCIIGRNGSGKTTFPVESQACSSPGPEISNSAKGSSAARSVTCRR